MSLASALRRRNLLGFPRVSGDEPVRFDADLWRRGFSPRERG